MKRNLLSKESEKLVIEGASRELEISNLYKHISNALEAMGYFGSSKFFHNESEEELKHYQVWADFMNARGSWLKIPALPGFTDEFKDLKAVFERYYDEEYKLGEFYNNWYIDSEDAAIMQQLTYFIEIQRKSIGEAGDFLATLNACGDDKGAILLFDKKIK